MQQHVPFEQLHQLFKTGFTDTGRSMEEFSSLYQKLPVPESARKRFLDAALKNKSAWYACLVNSNIDALLLPEYIESKQNRNILIKKETDQYFRSLECFSLLSGKSNASLYECILVSGDVPHKQGVDLFSGQAMPETEKCPAHINRIFDNWNLTLAAHQGLEAMVYGFLEWHTVNAYTFSGQRQALLWLNYQLFRQYGQAAFAINIEDYLFHHWQKQNLDPEKAVGGLLKYMQESLAKNLESLRELYKNHIDFDILRPGQKLASGYLFSIGFNVQLPSHALQLPCMKHLLKKGYMEVQDLGQKADLEKIKQVVDELFHVGMIFMVNEEGYAYISLDPSYRSGQDGRLDAYTNLQRPGRHMDWDGFAAQAVVKVIAPKVAKIAAEPEAVPVKRRQKAFFG